jgi:hypothetical protein
MQSKSAVPWTIPLLLVLLAGASVSSSNAQPPTTTPPSPSAGLGPCDATATITFAPNPDHPRGAGRCDVSDVSPDPVHACAGGTITWIFDNQCDRRLPARIGKRRPKYPKRSNGEPLVTPNELRPVPFPVLANSTSTVTIGVKATAEERVYKYDITGDPDIETDPEIDVRRGGGAAPPPPLATPAPSPSPRGGR